MTINGARPPGAEDGKRPTHVQKVYRGGTSFEQLKCRYCAFTTNKYRTRKDGKVTSGWVRLQDHLEDEHGIVADLVGERDDGA